MEESFSEIRIRPHQEDTASSLIQQDDENKWETSAFFLDSSGRSSIPISIELQCPSKELPDQLIELGCLEMSSTTASSSSSSADESKNISNDREYSLDLEVKATASPPQDDPAANQKNQQHRRHLKQAHIESTKVHRMLRKNDKVIILDAVIHLRIAGSQQHFSSATETWLDITAVLARRQFKDDRKQPTLVHPDTIPRKRITHTRLQPFHLKVSLSHAFALSTKSVPGPLPGHTLLSLTMAHTDMHEQAVTITNVALHPGHSIQQASHREVCDMTNVMRWNYMEDCDPGLPVTMGPHETISTILHVSAANDICPRSFTSPISVSAVVGTHKVGVLAAADVQWTTAAATVEPSDAFRVDFVTPPLFQVKQNETVRLEFQVSSLAAVPSPHSSTIQVSFQQNTPPGTKKTSTEGFAMYDREATTSSASNELILVDEHVELLSLPGTGQLRVIPLQAGVVELPPLAIVTKDGERYLCQHSLRLTVV